MADRPDLSDQRVGSGLGAVLGKLQQSPRRSANGDVDGSIKFVNESIDMLTYRYLRDRQDGNTIGNY